MERFMPNVLLYPIRLKKALMTRNVVFMQNGYIKTKTTLIKMKIQDNGPDKDRLNLVFFGDEFTAAEEAKFNSSIQTKLAYLNTLEPLKSNLYKVNAYSFFNPSQDSGINHPNLLGAGCYGQPQLLVNTYFGCSFDSIVSGSTRLHRAIAPASTAFVKAEMVKMLPQALNKINFLPIIICNTEFEGGLEYGDVSMCTLSPYSNGTLAHELLGHTIGGVGD